MSPTPLQFAISLGHGGGSVVAGAHAFARALGKRLGETIKNVVVANYEDLLAEVLAERAAIAWMPPVLGAQAIEKGVRLVAIGERDGTRTYRSALLVRKGSAHTLQSLAGVRAAWTDPHSAAGYIFPRLQLLAAGLDLDKALVSERFYGSYLAACGAVSDEEADLCACFVPEKATAGEAAAMAEVKRVYAAAPWRLQVLALTDSIPSDGVVVRAGLDDALRVRITDALLQLHRQPDGRDALQQLMYASRLAAPDDAILRSLARLRRDLARLRPRAGDPASSRSGG